MRQGPVPLAHSMAKMRQGPVPVAHSALTVEIGPGMSLMHVPTMLVPQPIKDPFVVYQCMRVTLIEAKKQGFQNIVGPLFGGATGELPANLTAALMRLAYKHVNESPKQVTWRDAKRIYDEYRSVLLREGEGE